MSERKYHDHFFDRGLRLWIIQKARRNYWRVASWMDLDDLIHEGFICYLICRQRYPVKNKSHMMALTKIAYINRLTDLANKRSREMEIAMSNVVDESDQEELTNLLAGGNDPDAEIAFLIQSAPVLVKAVLDEIMKHPEKLRVTERRKPGPRETTNQFYCRIAKVPEFDFRGALRELLA